MPPLRLTSVARSENSATQSGYPNRSLRVPPGCPGDSRRVAPGVPGSGPPGCPNDQPPGARVRHTPLPKRFASSAAKLARRLPFAWSPFPVTDGFVVGRRTLHKGFPEEIFDAQGCPQEAVGCPPNPCVATRHPPTCAKNLWTIMATIFSSRRRRPPVATAPSRWLPHRPRLAGSRRGRSASRHHGTAPPGRLPPAQSGRRR